MNRTLTASLAVAVSLLVARTASADTKSWTAVKKVIGKGDTSVIGIDLTKLRTTASFQAGVNLMLDSEPEARQVFDMVKSDCGIDITTAVSDITIVMQKTGDDPLIAFGLDGVDEAKVVDCMGIVAGSMTGMPGIKLKGAKKGKVTEYSVKGEKKKLYFAWLTKDVLAFTDDPNDKKKLDRRLTGKGAGGDLKTFISRSSPAAALWFAVAQKEVEDGRTILGGQGKIEIAGGTAKASGAILLTKPADAVSMAAEGNTALVDAKTEVAGLNIPELARALGTVTITAAGNEVVISGSIPDKDIVTVIPQLDKIF